MKKILLITTALLFVFNAFAQKVKHKKQFTELNYDLKNDYAGFQKAMRGAEYSNGPMEIILQKEDTQKVATIGRKGRMMLRDYEVIRIRVWRAAIFKGTNKDGSIKISFEKRNTSLVLNYDFDATDSSFHLIGERVKYGKTFYTITAGVGSSLYIKRKHYASMRKPKGHRVKF